RDARALARNLELASGGLSLGTRAFPLGRLRGVALRPVLVAFVGRRRALRGRGGLSGRRARAALRAPLIRPCGWARRRRVNRSPPVQPTRAVLGLWIFRGAPNARPEMTAGAMPAACAIADRAWRSRSRSCPRLIPA